MRIPFLALSIAFAIAAAGAGLAAAEAEPLPAGMAAEQPSPPPTGVAAGAPSAPPSVPPLAGNVTQEQCEALMRTDEPWRDKLRKQIERSLTEKLWKKVQTEFTADQADVLRLAIHEEDSTLLVRNKRHVVLAYAALWIITVLFVLQLWWRQRSLKEEIERLHRDVKAAADEA